MKIRRGRPEDAEELLDIYRPVVLDTVISFEDTPPEADEFRARMNKCLDSHAWLVAEVDGRLGGYAYATGFRARPAYRYSVETTIYLDKNHRNMGIGRRLYEALFDELSQGGFCQAFAGIALPNDASIALHRSVGFEHVGTLNSVGFKFDKWHDVSWWQRAI